MWHKINPAIVKTRGKSIRYKHFALFSINLCLQTFRAAIMRS